MKTTKLVTILLALVLLTAPTARSAEKPAEKQISNTRTASCLVKVTTDPSVLPGGIIAIDYLMHSSSVAGKAAREVLGISPDIASGLIEVEEIESIFPDSAGLGMPSDYQPWASTYGTTTTSRSTRPTATTPERTATRTPTTRTPRPRVPTTTTTRRTYPTRITTPTRPKPTLTQPPPSRTEQTILFRLQVDLSQASTEEPIKPAAEEFMMALIEKIRIALSGVSEQHSAKLNNQLKLADEETARAEHELVRMQAELRDISGSRDLSRNVILRDISNLRQKLQTAKMKRASDESLCEVTAKRIAEEQARRKKLVENDPIAREFKSILDLYEKRLKDAQMRVAGGTESLSEYEDIKEKTIRARIELAKRQEEVSNPPGSIVLSSLSDELADLSTEVAVVVEEIYSFERQLKEAEKLLEKADDYELLSLKADIARQNLEETLLWRARLGRNIRSIQPPDVTVIGAE